MRVLPEDVYLALAVWKEVCDEYDLVCVEDVRGVSKLVKCVQIYVSDWKDWDVGEKWVWLKKYFEYLVENGKKGRSAWRWLLDYLDSSVADAGVKEVVDIYERYVQSRFGVEIDVDVRKKEVVKAARVIRKIAKEMGLSIEEVIAYQHECWDRIDKPLVFEGMGDEVKVKRRLEVYLDLKRKNAIVEEKRKRENSGEEEKKLENIWRTVLGVGIVFYLQKNGFIGEMARECWEKIKDVSDPEEKKRILSSYTPEKVLQRWIEAGRPRIL